MTSKTNQTALEPKAESSTLEKKDKHYWFIDECKANGSEYTVFCYSEFRPDGSHYPAKVDVKRVYRSKEGDVKTYYQSYQGSAISDVMRSLAKAQAVNEKYFGFTELTNINVPQELKDME